MKKFLRTAAIVAFILVVLKPGYSDESKNEIIIPEVDTGCHSARITGLLAMKDGRHIITASEDKSIRIWDTVTGIEKQRILGQTGSANDGAVYAIAMTPDERYLASGGVFNTDNTSAIRIFDLSTGELVQVLKSHIKDILDLSISNDGRYLASASSDQSVKIWDINNKFKLIQTLPLHTGAVSAVRIFKNNNDYNIISAGHDGVACIWSLSQKKIIRQQKYDFILHSVAVSNEFIAIAGNSKTIDIYDLNLNLIKRITQDNEPVGLSFSPDGRLLLAGAGSYPYICNIYNIKGNRKTSYCLMHQGYVRGVGFIDNNTAVSAGGFFKVIYLWDSMNGTGSYSKDISGNGNSNGVERYIAGMDGNNIVLDSLGGGASFGLFNLDNYKLVDYEPGVKFKTIDKEYGDYSLAIKSGGYLVKNAVLVLKKNSKEIFKVADDSSYGLRYRNFGFTNDGIIFSGGKSGRLEAFSPDGRKLASLIGHKEYVTSIAVYGDRLISGSTDQTIKIWNINDIRKGKKEINPAVTVFISKHNEEWIIWNEQGFYDTSLKGERFMGWHINHGPDKSAEYYTAKQFRRYLYRPDIIKKTLELGSGELAIKETVNTEPSLANISLAELVKRAPLNVKIESVEEVENGFADIKIRLGNNKTTLPERITIYVNGAQSLTDKERILKNVKTNELLAYRVKLNNHFNKIRVTVENKWGESSAYTKINKTRPDDLGIIFTKKTTLYIVAVGIKNYPYLSKEQQLNSPPIDAKSIAETFSKLNRRLYKNVDVLLLTDEDGKTITSDMVEKAVLEQTRKAGPLDTTIIFLAGHGVTDLKGDYHFITGDTNIKTAYGMQGGISETTTYSWTKLHKALDSTMGRRVVIVDTCQAGEVFSKSNTDISKLVKEVHDVNAIIYTGTSRQDSGIETKEGGVFTTSLISGITGKAYSGADPFLEITKLKEFVDQDVPERNEQIKKRQIQRAIKLEIIDKKEADASDTQKPVAVIPEGMEDFVIYLKP